MILIDHLLIIGFVFKELNYTFSITNNLKQIVIKNDLLNECM